MKIKTEKIPLLNEQVSNNHHGKMGLRFFKGLPKDIRYEIASYLSEKDLRQLRAVSKDLHGPIAKVNNQQEWTEKTWHFIMSPTYSCLNLEGEDRVNDYGVCFTFGVFSGCITFPIAVLASPVAFFAGTLKDVMVNRNINSSTEYIAFTR